MRIFILEDDPQRQDAFMRVLKGHDYSIASTVEHAKRLWMPPYDLLLLDHDLDHGKYPDAPTGYDFVKWIDVGKPIAPRAVIHSYNPDGATNMLTTLDKYVPTIRWPFGPSLLTELAKL